MQRKVDWIWVYLMPRGRLTRLPYFLANLLMSVLATIVLWRHVLPYLPEHAENIFAIPGVGERAWLIYMVTLWPTLALSAKRFQDLGLTPFLAALVAVPGVSMMAYLALCLMPGKEGANAYGAVRNAPPGRR